MNAGILPLLFLCGALGLALSAAHRKNAWFSVAALVATALLVSVLFKPHSDWEDLIFVSLWVSIAILATLVYLPSVLSARWAVTAGVIAGLSAGMTGSLSGGIYSVLLAVPATLLFLPGAWILRRGYGVSVKVVASWIIAISVLAAMVTMTPTPGYKPDHME